MLRYLCKCLQILFWLGIFIHSPRGSAAQKQAPRVPVQSTNTQADLDRLALSLIDRLPTEKEKEFARSMGARGTIELANQWINGKEFFDRQTLYWQHQISQTPAWLWEYQDAPGRLFVSPKSQESDHILWFFNSASQRGETLCTGVWTTRGANKSAGICSCDNTIAVIPSWDLSGSMRVCPEVKNDEICGQNLQKCVPADARLNPTDKNLATDLESAGGRAISRLLFDLTFIQGRALAWATITKQKWTQLSTLPTRVLHARSSIELLQKWKNIAPDSQIAMVSEMLSIHNFASPVEDFIRDAQFSRAKKALPSPINGLAAEDLLLSSELDPRLSVYPLRTSGLVERVWKWNTDLLLNCRKPHLASQMFPLPLPHPNRAKEGSYFCSSCHFDLDKKLKTQNLKTENESNSASEKILTAESKQDCAIEHALHFLLGEQPIISNYQELRQIGKKSYSENEESLSFIIRDIALEMMRKFEP